MIIAMLVFLVYIQCFVKERSGGLRLRIRQTV